MHKDFYNETIEDKLKRKEQLDKIYNEINKKPDYEKLWKMERELSQSNNRYEVRIFFEDGAQRNAFLRACHEREFLKEEICPVIERRIAQDAAIIDNLHVGLGRYKLQISFNALKALEELRQCVNTAFHNNNPSNDDYYFRKLYLVFCNSNVCQTYWTVIEKALNGTV